MNSSSGGDAINAYPDRVKGRLDKGTLIRRPRKEVKFFVLQKNWGFGEG